jgi:hypothetical protein
LDLLLCPGEVPLESHFQAQIHESPAVLRIALGRLAEHCNGVRMAAVPAQDNAKVALGFGKFGVDLQRLLELRLRFMRFAL